MPAILVAFVAASIVCVSLAGRRLSWWRLSIAVAISQLFFHALLSIDFGLLAGAGGGSLTGHAHHAVVPLASSLSGAVATAMSPLMWAAHVLAAAVTVLVFGFGERAVLEVLRFMRSVFRALRATPVARVRPDMRAVEAVVLFAPRSIVLSVVRRRGPPVWAG